MSWQAPCVGAGAVRRLAGPSSLAGAYPARNFCPDFCPVFRHCRCHIGALTPALSATGHDGTMRVLVVEDERLMADAIVEWLRRETFAVDVAYDGDAALERF